MFRLIFAFMLIMMWGASASVVAQEAVVNPKVNYCDQFVGVINVQRYANLAVFVETNGEQKELALAQANALKERLECFARVREATKSNPLLAKQIDAHIAKNNSVLSDRFNKLRIEFEANVMKYHSPKGYFGEPKIAQYQAALASVRKLPDFASMCGNFNFEPAAVDAARSRHEAFKTCFRNYLNQNSRVAVEEFQIFQDGARRLMGIRRYTCSQWPQPNCVPNDQWVTFGGDLATQTNRELIDDGMQRLRADLSAAWGFEKKVIDWAREPTRRVEDTQAVAAKSPIPTPDRRESFRVNGAVINFKDVDERIAWLRIGNSDQVDVDGRIRARVTRDLIDETLKIQEGEAQYVLVSNAEVDLYFEVYAAQLGKTPDQFGVFLKEIGSTSGTVKRLIHSQLVWRQLLQPDLNPGASDDEMDAVIAYVNRFGRVAEFRVSEIFLPAAPQTSAQVMNDANTIFEQLRLGTGTFASYARQYSKASTAAKDGNVGWVRSAQLPPEVGAVIGSVPVGAVSNPVPTASGVYIIYVADIRTLIVTGEDPDEASILPAKGTQSRLVDDKIRQREHRYLQDLRRDGIIEKL